MKDWAQYFYNSKQWRLLRAYTINRDRYICKLCGELITDTPEVHHTTPLTEENYADPFISLNADLLETLHHKCHDKRHGRFCRKEKETIVDDDLNIDYSRRC